MPIYEICKLFRYKHHWTQKQIADDLNCTRENVAMFERGYNNNPRILQWYIDHGLKDDQFFKLCSWAMTEVNDNGTGVAHDA